jgi:hypothetical protein
MTATTITADAFPATNPSRKPPEDESPFVALPWAVIKVEAPVTGKAHKEENGEVDKVPEGEAEHKRWNLFD